MGWDCKKDTLNQIITMAHDAEMSLYEDAKRSNRYYWYNNNPTQATGLDPNAMDIDATRTDKAGPNGRTVAQFLRAMNGKCFGCGSTQHTKKDGRHERDLCAWCK